MSNEISDEFCSAMRCECSKCNPLPRNDTSSEISDEAILKAALQNDFDGFITINPLGMYCVGDFVRVSREQALAAQAELDEANEVTNEMLDAASQAWENTSAFRGENKMKNAIKAALDVRSK